MNDTKGNVPTSNGAYKNNWDLNSLRFYQI